MPPLLLNDLVQEGQWIKSLQHIDNKNFSVQVISTLKSHPDMYELGYQWKRVGCDYQEMMGTCVFFHKDKWEIMSLYTNNTERK